MSGPEHRDSGGLNDHRSRGEVEVVYDEENERISSLQDYREELEEYGCWPLPGYPGKDAPGDE